MLGKITALLLALSDWVLPYYIRLFTNAPKRVYPISYAQQVMKLLADEDKIDVKQVLQSFRDISVDSGASSLAWGLGFPWMSKNGLYGPEVPFVTHTPYVMEALVSIHQNTGDSTSIEMFNSTWFFLDSLLVMHETTETLALSYAPIDEPRIVVNANSYAALSYALHACYGPEEKRSESIEKVEKIVRWIFLQQQADGSWFYYADRDEGNFIDCFHSCFVIKNLLKIQHLLPRIESISNSAIKKGWTYIQEHFFDRKTGLCSRFVKRSHKDPFQLDLYDQAEYLGLLVDFGRIGEAESFADRVETKFKRSNIWYCRIDIFGLLWGKDFMRWGIQPFIYQLSRLQRKIGQ